MDYVGRADFTRTMIRPSLAILSCRRCARREQQTEKRGHLIMWVELGRWCI
jgi:hypothetical protein